MSQPSFVRRRDAAKMVGRACQNSTHPTLANSEAQLSNLQVQSESMEKSKLIGTRLEACNVRQERRRKSSELVHSSASSCETSSMTCPCLGCLG